MAKKNDSLGDRMKGYEGVSRNFLTRPMSESNAARIPGYSVITLGSVAIVSLSLLTS